MRAQIARHALDRVPLSIIFDDSTVLVNLNYFFMRDYNIEVNSNPNLTVGRDYRWEDVPIVHPESFTREFAEFCLEHGVKGKFSIVPCPAALGRIDEGLPLFSKAQQESWLQMCRELIVPAFDITPEMLTHTFVIDPETLEPVESRAWEQYEWRTLPEDEDLIERYITKACEILANVDLMPAGVTSPGGFGKGSLDFYSRMAGLAVRQVTGNPLPYFFHDVELNGPVETRVWHVDRNAGTAVGEIVAGTSDWTGSWTGYGEVNVDRYITADLQGGRLPALINAGDPAVMISHWQGFYGMHDGDRRGFNTFKTVVRRLHDLDPRGERTRWRKCGEITGYACAREMAEMEVEGNSIILDLPACVPEFTLELKEVDAVDVAVDGKPLRRVGRRVDFESGTFLVEGDTALVAFDPVQRDTRIEIAEIS
jgi:hypothetical protein